MKFVTDGKNVCSRDINSTASRSVMKTLRRIHKRKIKGDLTITRQDNHEHKSDAKCNNTKHGVLRDSINAEDRGASEISKDISANRLK